MRSEGESVVTSPLKLQYQYAQVRMLMRFRARRFWRTQKTAVMSTTIKQRGSPEHNIIVARDSQSGQRKC